MPGKLRAWMVVGLCLVISAPPVWAKGGGGGSRSSSHSSGGSVHVRSYTRKDGTHVSAHTRSAPGTGLGRISARTSARTYASTGARTGVRRSGTRSPRLLAAGTMGSGATGTFDDEEVVEEDMGEAAEKALPAERVPGQSSPEQLNPEQLTMEQELSEQKQARMKAEREAAALKRKLDDIAAAKQSDAESRKNERIAESKLALAKILIEKGNATAGKRRLEELIAEFPRTKAAEEGRKMLARL